MRSRVHHGLNNPHTLQINTVRGYSPLKKTYEQVSDCDIRSFMKIFLFSFIAVEECNFISFMLKFLIKCFLYEDVINRIST